MGKLDDNDLNGLNMDLNVSHTNYDGVTTLGNVVDGSDAGTIPCVDARLVDSRYILKLYGHTFLHHYNLYFITVIVIRTRVQCRICSLRFEIA